MEDKEFNSKDELFQYLKTNKNLLIAEKKSALKCSDPMSGSVGCLSEEDGFVAKGIELNTDELLKKDSIDVTIVINTCGLMDSHRDVHIPGIWKKTLKESKSLYHLQEHGMSFRNVISDEVNASSKSMNWSDLGAQYNGSTEALIFKSKINKSRNPYMFEQYASGYVKQHSVGMRYIKLFLCVNSDHSNYVSEKENWDKYISYVVNKQEAEEVGYFWAVTEAKLIEGSAVLMGSNNITPTFSVKSPSLEPPECTQEDNKPETPLQKKIDFSKMSNIKLN